MFRHDLRRNQLDDGQNAQRDNDDMVQVAEDRHEVGNQINRRKRVACHAKGERLGVPWHTIILRTWNQRMAAERIPSLRKGPVASAVASGNSSCTESLPWGSRTVRMPGTPASASISARDFGGVSAP